MLKRPVVGYFGTLDQEFSPEMAEGFRVALAQSDKTGKMLFYYANHAFSSVGDPNFDAQSAALAERRTLGYLHKHFG